MATSNEHHSEATRFLLDRVNYETFHSIPYSERNLKLDRMRGLLARLGHPEAGLPIVHVAGTKGKGSTCAMLAGMVQAAGCSVGVFSSPHIERVEERLSVDGLPCPADEFVALVEELRPAVQAMDAEADEGGDEQLRPTFFELTTALALMRFARCRVGLDVLEVGLGGRLDSTNVCQPVVSVITGIGFDHMQQLGSTLEEITAEKAGILKPGVPVVCGPMAEGPRGVIAEAARRNGCRVVWAGEDFRHRYHAPGGGGPGRLDYWQRTAEGETRLEGIPLAMVGEHQAANAAVALAVVQELRGLGWEIPEQSMATGLAATRLAARFEVVAGDPTVVLDGAHNVPSAESVVASLRACGAPPEPVLLFGATREKDVAGMVRVLLPAFRHVVVTDYRENPRSVAASELAEVVRREAERLGRSPSEYLVVEAALAENGLREARRLARGTGQWVCITGSFFLVAALRGSVLEGENDEVADCWRASDQMSQRT